MARCFVVMGFGEKTDLATGRKLDMDKTYKNIIKPAVEAAGHACVRADEILHSGTIDKPMYDMLFDAELVIADLSTANLNAAFELGIRHALKPRSTIIIAENKFVSPFDVNHVVIRRYEHLGTDIGFSEAMRMQKDLRELIEAVVKNNDPDSPVYTFMKLTAPTRQGAPPAVAAPAEAGGPQADSFAAQLEKAFAAKAASDFATAETILRQIHDAQATEGKTADPRVIQELALATYKSWERKAKEAGPQAALDGYAKALDLLSQLDPERTTDPETLGLWAAVHKRLAENDQRSDVQRSLDLDTAIAASERGFLIRQDYYTGINYAYLLDYRASRSSGDNRIADRVLADRARRRVADIARAHIALVEAKLQTPGNNTYKDELYWTRATLAEALIVLGDPAGPVELEKAKRLASATWMTDATLQQIEKLKQLRA